MSLLSVEDQAAGLRRLFDNRPSPLVSFVSGRDGSGRTTLLIRAAASLARSGQRVILVDEHSGASSAMAALRSNSAGDLLDVVAGKLSLKRAVRQIEPQLWALRGEKAAIRLRTDTPGAMDAGDVLVEPLRSAANFVLIDSRVENDGHLSLLSARATHMVVVVDAQPDAITLAYGVIKRLARERGRDGFHMVVTRSRSEDEAAAIFNNVRRTAYQHLGVRVDYLGNFPVPATADMADSLQGGLLLAPAYQ